VRGAASGGQIVWLNSANSATVSPRVLVCVCVFNCLNGVGLQRQREAKKKNRL
jgi:hypothetical protein